MNSDVKKAMFALRDDLERNPLAVGITVQRKDLELVVHQLYFGNDEWSNQSALGYAIAAAKAEIFMDREIKTLINNMRKEFDFKTLEEAANIYRESDY